VTTLKASEHQIFYVRLGAPPPSGRSANHEDGHCEAAVSCYEALLRDQTVWIRGDGLDLAATRNKLREAQQQGRTVYVLTGRIVGSGSDGEPLLELHAAKLLDGYSARSVQVALPGSRLFADRREGVA
jgi:hypothetical protein